MSINDVSTGVVHVCERERETNLLRMSLEDVDRVDGRVSEVPQSEGGVSG